MKGWTIEELERYEGLVNIIIAAEQKEAAGTERYNEIEARNEGADGSLARPFEYAPPIEYAYSSAAYKEAVEVLNEDYKVTAKIAKDRLAEAREILFDKHIENHDIDKALKVAASLSAAGSKPYENPKILDTLINNASSLGQETKDALLVRAIALLYSPHVKTLAKNGARITDEGLQAVFKSGWHIMPDSNFVLTLAGNAKSVSSETLVLAITKGVSEDMLKSLVSKVSNKNDLESALKIAVEKNDGNVAKLLLDKDANPNIVLADGHTALNHAVEIGNVELVQTLLLRGADVHGNEATLEKVMSRLSGKTKADMEELFKLHAAVEKDFKENFMPGISSVIKEMGDTKELLTDAYVTEKFNKALQAAYDTNDSFKSSFVNSEGTIAKEFRLGFVDEFLITMEAAWKAISSDLTYQQIKFSKMAEMIYVKIQETPKFQALTAFSIGKEVDVRIEANKLNQEEKPAEKTKQYEIRGEHTRDFVEKLNKKSTPHMGRGE